MSRRRSAKCRAIRNLKRAIRELNRSIDAIRDERFETAENRIADALVFQGRALRQINRAERFDYC
ncbi:hypothetical protein C1X05_09760 [Laceyella sacchari]|uniref:Uncharacterized protein n=1 Tax=Laceyella tengchongensis TaxID=574699 RepID=A0AA46AH55_9BACL|nr:hypothetical protein [Laceyella tengchongensis]AUS09108.1 hypothetical protein C1X05_09760 [Laceyella sacchari]SMP35490.1 hypothetical protein SAMN06265361_11312 [Laceyella tengchongensis]